MSAISVHLSPDIWEGNEKSNFVYTLFGNLTDLPRYESQDKGRIKVIYIHKNRDIKRSFSHNSKFRPCLPLLSRQRWPVWCQLITYRIWENISIENEQDKPVDLNIAPVTAPAAILPIVSCFPLAASMEELTPLYKRAIKGLYQRAWSKSTLMQTLPITPAELPMKVPLRVTEFRTLLIRNLVFDTARGLRAPSRTPHTPPRAKPEKKKKGWACDKIEQ